MYNVMSRTDYSRQKRRELKRRRVPGTAALPSRWTSGWGRCRWDIHRGPWPCGGACGVAARLWTSGAQRDDVVRYLARRASTAHWLEILTATKHGASVAHARRELHLTVLDYRGASLALLPAITRRRRHGTGARHWSAMLVGRERTERLGGFPRARAAAYWQCIPSPLYVPLHPARAGSNERRALHGGQQPMAGRNLCMRDALLLWEAFAGGRAERDGS